MFFIQKDVGFGLKEGRKEELFLLKVAGQDLAVVAAEVDDADLAFELGHVRYIGGDVAYEKRQHYFTAWINDNVEEGIVTDIQVNPPFTSVQHINVNWMTTHQSSYKMLNGNAVRLKGIKALENSINGKSYRYIPILPDVSAEAVRGREG